MNCSGKVVQSSELADWLPQSKPHLCNEGLIALHLVKGLSPGLRHRPRSRLWSNGTEYRRASDYLLDEIVAALTVWSSALQLRLKRALIVPGLTVFMQSPRPDMLEVR